MTTPRRTHRIAFAALLLIAGLSHAAPNSGLDLPSFDRSVRVQDDLFRSVNGSWIKNTEIPADKSYYGSFIKLRDLSDQRVRAIVEELAAKPQAKGSVQDKIAAFYSAYVDTAAIEKAGLAPLQPLLASIDAIQSSKELATWLGRMQGVVNGPVALGVDPDFKEPLVNRTATWQGGLGMPDRDYYLKDDDKLTKVREAYRVYLTELARLAGEKDPTAVAAGVLALERQLAETHWSKVDNRNPVKLYNPMTPAELAQRAPGFDWSAFFAGAQLAGIDRLSVSQPSMVEGAAKLFESVPLASWKQYLKLRVIDENAVVLPQAFRAAHFAFQGKAQTGATEERPRWQQGIGEVNGALGEAIGQVYVERHFPAAYKARMLELVGNLMAAYRESIDGLSWMSAETKAGAQAKLAKYTVKIGYPEVWRDYSKLEVKAGDALGNRIRAGQFEWQRQAQRAGKPVNRKEWFITPQTVNAFYDPTRNEIVFPAAFLEAPYFDMKADDAANYGAIGGVIGHEISHGFDDQGSQFDGDGALRNWWTEADRKAFEAIGDKLAAEFNSYEPIPGKHVNGRLTMGENIADLSGIQVAYKAYKRSLGGKPAPVLDGFSGEQRFFLGWAQAWRSKAREERVMQLLTTDPHSPDQFRANGPAANTDGFHEAFATKPGDKMFKPGEQRIRIW